MQTVLETLFTKFFTDTPFPFFIFLIGLSVGTYAWLREIYSCRSEADDLSPIGKGIQLVFIGTMLVFYVLVAVAVILSLSTFVITIAAAVAYFIKVIIPGFMQSYEITGGALAAFAMCIILTGVALIYKRDSIVEFISRKFKRGFDPVKDCRLHINHGCSHVDGYLCNKSCDEHPDHVKEVIVIQKEKIDGEAV